MSAFQDIMGVNARPSAMPRSSAEMRGVAYGTARAPAWTAMRARPVTCAKRGMLAVSASTNATLTLTASVGGGAQRLGNASARRRSRDRAAKRALWVGSGTSARTRATRRGRAATQAGAPLVRSGPSVNAMPSVRAALAESARTACTGRIAAMSASGIRRAVGTGGVLRTGAASARPASVDPIAACALRVISDRRAKDDARQHRAVDMQGDARRTVANASTTLPGQIARCARPW